MINISFVNFSQAADNNKEVIADRLAQLLQQQSRVLEIGSGSGQHAIHMAQRLPDVRWQPSDQGEYIEGLRVNIKQLAPSNVQAPIYLDIDDATDNNKPWPRVNLIYTANVLHIMPERLLVPLFAGAAKALDKAGFLCIYGPFKYRGEFTTPSNANFDQWLKQHNPDSGIRDIEQLQALATEHAMTLRHDYAMPANNQFLVFQKNDGQK